MAFYLGATEVINDSANLVASVSGNVLQVVSHTTTNSTSGNFGTTSSNPSTSNGIQYTTFTFTPVSSTSKILITSSNLSLYENSNVADTFYMAAYYDTTRIAISYCPNRNTSYRDYKNMSYQSFNQVFDSWGTSQKTIQVRVGAAGANATDLVVNRDTDYPNQHGNPEVTFTLVEYQP